MDFILRKWRCQDAEDVARRANNKKIAQNLRDAFPYPYTLEAAQCYVDSCVEEDEERQICRAIEVDGRPVGSIGLFRGDDVYCRSAELGYWLAEEYWGRGVMTRAVLQMCREGFARWDIVRIYAEPFARNAGSRRVLEKAGFTLESVMRQGVCKWGEVCDYCVYALLKEEDKQKTISYDKINLDSQRGQGAAIYGRRSAESSAKEVRHMPITITFHLRGVTVTIKVKWDNRHSAK